MLAFDGQIPCCIGFFFVKREPSRYNFELLSWQRACQKFSVNSNNSFLFAIVNMNMGLVVLSDVLKQHINHHAAKSTQFRHIITLLLFCMYSTFSPKILFPFRISRRKKRCSRRFAFFAIRSVV